MTPMVPPRFQFTIRGLMWVTFCVALGFMLYTHLGPAAPIVSVVIFLASLDSKP